MMQNTNDCVVEMDRWSSINPIQDWSSIMIITSFFSLHICQIPTPSEDQSESLLYSPPFAFFNPHFILNSPCL